MAREIITIAPCQVRIYHAGCIEQVALFGISLLDGKGKGVFRTYVELKNGGFFEAGFAAVVIDGHPQIRVVKGRLTDPFERT